MKIAVGFTRPTRLKKALKKEASKTIGILCIWELIKMPYLRGIA